MTDTIAAIATAPGEGAIALLRISGPESIAIAEFLFQGKVKPSAMKTQHQHFGKIIHHGEILDEVLLTLFRAPHSYTGEDLVEMSCHGGTIITTRLLEALLLNGARLARPGEFTQRAYLHGKMDLTQAEAVMDLITSQTKRSQRAAMEQLSGHLGQEIRAIRAELLAAVAHLEASLDFPEEDINPETGNILQNRIRRAREHLVQLLSTAHEGRLLREGICIALCGSPNAGKSSLLNCLLGRNRAIVSPIAGTTRDTLEESATLGGFPFRIIDTAGLRVAEDAVEREGVERARHAAESADICLHLIDATAVGVDIQSVINGELLVFNKVDLISDRSLLTKAYPSTLLISCVTGEGIEHLISHITEYVTQKKSFPTETTPAVAINKRHQVCLERALQAVDAGLMIIDKKEALELLSVELHSALEAIGAVVGEANTEEILGEIFGNFCIGK